MLDTLTLRPDLARTAARFDAWWRGELIDRPPVTLWVKPTRPYRGPIKEHASERERWLDVEFNVDAMIATMEQRDHVGDAFPTVMPNIGPELTSTPFGCELEFGPCTSWSVPPIHDIEQWQAMIDTPPNFDNPYWQTIERMTRLALDKCNGRYLVGLPDLHGNLDILAGLREPQMLCMDLLDDLPLISRALDHAVEGYLAGLDRMWRMISAAGHPATTWTHFLHPERAYVPSSDFWCMLSDELARDLVLPAIVREMSPLQRSIFHLDGPQALRHLDLLLDLPRLNAIQWVYGDGHGPAANWLDVYRRCRQRGKSVEVIAEGPADALAVLDALGPEGVWLRVQGSFDSVAEAGAYLREVERLTVSRVGATMGR